MNKFVAYKNAKIHFSDTGKGDPVVLLHGFLEDISMWKTIQIALAKKNRVICIDLLGHGKSDCLGYVHSMELMAEAVKFVLDELSIDAAFFIGHSMGGYVALALADEYNTVISGLCLMNSTTQPDTKDRIKIRDRAIKMAQTNYEPLVSMSINNLFSQETRAQYALEIEESKKIALQTSVQSYIACSEGMKQRKDKEHVLLKAAFKKLIIAGKKDSVLLFDNIVSETERTQTSLIALSNGHMSYIENKSELIVALKDFIN